MVQYTSVDAQQYFEKLLEEAQNEHDVMITNARGDIFLLRLVTKKPTPRRVPRVKVGLTREEIVSYVREVRER